MRDKVLALSEKEIDEASSAIFSRVAALPQFARASTVALYVSLPDEPRTEAFLLQMCHHKRLVVPKIEGDDMQFYTCRPGNLSPGAFGIGEPSDDAELCPAGEIDLIIVPGRAFTLRGERLGRGKGFYDRWLSRSGFRGYSVGVCFGVQICGELPSEPHDIRVDAVITEH